MNQGVQTFLTLNAVLNGYRVEESFEGGIEQAAEVLGVSCKKAQQLSDDLAGLEKDGFPPMQDVVQASLVNFFRNDEYAFIAPPNVKPISLRAVAEFERGGVLDVGQRQGLLMQFVRYLDGVSSTDEVCIADGVFYTPDVPTDVLAQLLEHAYRLVVNGPDPDNSRLMKRRNMLTISSYKEFSPSVLLGILNELVKRKVPPTAFRDTVFMIPDYMTTYQNLGVLVEASPVRADSMCILVPVRGTNSAVPVTLGCSVVAGLLGDNVRALSVLEYQDGYGQGETKGLRFKYEKV